MSISLIAASNQNVDVIGNFLHFGFGVDAGADGHYGGHDDRGHDVFSCYFADIRRLGVCVGEELHDPTQNILWTSVRLKKRLVSSSYATVRQRDRSNKSS